MRTLRLRPNLPTVAVLAAAAFASAIALRADDQPPAAAKPQLAKEMIGTWALAGTPERDLTPRLFRAYSTR
jgi:hypothetical protein